MLRFRSENVLEKILICIVVLCLFSFTKKNYPVLPNVIKCYKTNMTPLASLPSVCLHPLLILCRILPPCRVFPWSMFPKVMCSVAQWFPQVSAEIKARQLLENTDII